MIQIGVLYYVLTRIISCSYASNIDMQQLCYAIYVGYGIKRAIGNLFNLPSLFLKTYVGCVRVVIHCDFSCVITEKEPRNCVTESFGRWPTIYSSLGLRSNQGDNHGYYRFRYHEGNSWAKSSISKGRQDQFSGKPWSRRVGGTSGCTGDGRIYQDQDWSRYGRRQPSQRYIRSRVDQSRQAGFHPGQDGRLHPYLQVFHL